MPQSIIDFLSSLSKSTIQGFSEALKNGGIGNSIKEGIEKFRKTLFIIGVTTQSLAPGEPRHLKVIASANLEENDLMLVISIE